MISKLMIVLELPWLTKPEDERSGCGIAVVVVHFVVDVCPNLVRTQNYMPERYVSSLFPVCFVFWRCA
jgi:hypothetical protein